VNNDLKSAIRKGELILFLGAGASKGCSTRSNTPLLDGLSLAAHLASLGDFEYSNEPLDEVYAGVRAKLGYRLDANLEELFRDTKPSPEYLDIAGFAWRRIYTLNIDDALETALRRTRVQNIHVQLSHLPIIDQDNMFGRLDVVKLNGSADRLDSGVIFSASEYATATARTLPWYEQCGSDFVRHPILFIGTKVNEPLLKFQIERYKGITGRTPGRSYVITPSATEFQKQALSDYNIVHISGTLADFAAWLKKEFPQPLSPIDLAIESMPQLAELISSGNGRRYAALFDHVVPIKRSKLLGNKQSTRQFAISDFYKGFRPSWKDIVEEIPARLDILQKSITIVLSQFRASALLPIVGPAGSGKTTLLMQLCYDLSTTEGVDVFYINQPIDDLAETLEAIENSSSADKVIVGMDNIDFSSDQLKEVFGSKRLQKTMLLGAERENIWKKKTRNNLGAFSIGELVVDQFTRNDASRILAKLELFGSWTRLGQMSEKARISELVDRAQSQLLIALLEATFGLGYGQIIASDYSSLVNDEERLCFLIVGLVTDRKQDVPVALVDRALASIGINHGGKIIETSLAGIVVKREGKLCVRHPVYVRYILDNLVDPSLTTQALQALLAAFSQYESPVIKHVDKLQAIIYKGLINHSFLRDVLKGRRDLVLSLYKSLEKKFEQDGLFWLQYGLSLRDFKQQQESLEKLRIACQAYPMEHTRHALAQQLLIVGDTVADKLLALAYAEEAREILEDLDRTIESDDTFPVVTLAEGYTKVMRRHAGEEAARREAKFFAERLKARSDANPEDSRLRSSYERMFRFSVTGTWIDADD